MASYEDIVNSLITSSDGSNETSTKISQALLDQLKKKYALEEGTDSGQIKTSSTFDKIQKQVDIDGETETDSEILAKFQSLIDTSNNQAKNLWNESIKVAVNYFIKRFLDENAVIPVSSETGLGQSEQGGFLIKDIRHANAGLSFNGTAWVKPNYNIDNDIYDDVRGDDKIESVLNNQRNMQFTRTQDQSQIVSETINKYIRLLMPQYTRRVEVEDLNRNFWVIGQVLAGISAYLFDEDSPITNMFKRLISEVNQLWENILYLWTAFNKPITKVHSEVLYLPNNSSSTETKFDNFDQTPTFDNITERLNYLVDQYSDSNLCIVPIIRRGNYYKNYYSIEQYSGIWFYDRNKSEWFYCTPAGDGTGDYGEYGETTGGVKYLQIKPDIEKIGGIYIDEEEFVYKYIYPLSDIVSQSELVPKRYFGGLRTVPKIECSYTNESGFTGKFILNVTDYTSEVAETGTRDEKYIWNFSTPISSATTIPCNYSQTGTKPTQTEISNVEISKGFYLGEIASIYKATKEINYSITNRARPLPPITEPLSTILYNDTIQNNVQNYSEDFLERYADDIESDDGIVLYTGSFDNYVFNSENSPSTTYFKTTSSGYDTVTGGGTTNFNPAFYNGTLVNLGNYSELNGTTKQSGEYWNRTRENIKLGCILSIPSFEPIAVKDYKYWWSHIPDAENSHGNHSLVRFYTREDQTLAGRRGDYYSFTTFYKKKGSSIKPGTWAIKYTEAFMNYGATSDGGVTPLPESLTTNLSLTDDSITYHLIGYSNKPGISYQRYKNYCAPFLREGSVDKSSWYYLLPIVTRIVTHIFIAKSETEVAYSRKYQYKIDMGTSGAVWSDSFQTVTGATYTRLNNSLGNNYEVYRQSSSVSDDTVISDAETMTGQELKGAGGNFWMDFERYPINGYSH